MAADYREEYIRILDETDNLYENEILRIIYGNAYGGKENPELVAALMERFPSVKSLMEADISELEAVNGMPANFALYLKTLNCINKFLNKNEIFMTGTEQCFKVIAERFRGKDNEYVEMYLVNKNGKVTDIKVFTSHKANKVDISASEIFSVISSSNAYGLYFAHNHVNASVQPSSEDDDVTGKIAVACDMCRIKFFDHCIINSVGDKFSYVKSGRMSNVVKKYR